KVAPWPLAPGARATYVLAAIDRPANAASITANTITDLRRLNLTLADVVDIAADLEPRVETMETAVNDIKNALTDINQKLGRLFWDVDMRASDKSAYFGATVTITVTVTNYLGPVAGTRVEFSTDYGVVSPSSAVTNADGRATTNLLGVEAARPPEENELPVLTNVASKVSLATRGDKSVFYSAMKFEPAEMSVISKYSPSSTFVDVERNLGTILPIPPSKTATVSCYAKEGAGTVVRGIGTVQVSYRQWVRDWVKTKIVDTVKEIDVSSRVGSKFGAAWNGEQKDLNVNFVKEGIGDIYSDVAAESQGKLVKQLFTDVVSDDDLGKAGAAGQSIAQAVASQVGQKTNQAVKTEISNFTNQGLDKSRAAGYQKTILQSSNQANAGVSQGFKMAFGSGGGFNVGG
ncbi:MAG: Ig-like domain-containing protein, partial [Chloroflexi bacterium]|nr:Ig-like domain-containing protein [Chloroflexota bacterium]